MQRVKACLRSRSAICGRCRRRRIPDRCFYHPSPMTQRRSSSSQPFQENSQQREDRSRSRTPLQTSVPNSKQPPKLRPAHSGFLGSTDYSTVFTEGESHLTVHREPETRLENINTAGYPDLLALESSDVKEGAQLLALMSEVPRY